jgi:DNA-3-methyladenine glycosylase II
MPAEFTITPSGPFSLAEAATFGFGQRDGGGWDGVMRLAFCLDGYDRYVGVEVRQDGAGGDPAGPAPADPDRPSAAPAGAVRCVVHGAGAGDLDPVRRQVARVLSLDHDAEPFTLVGQRDPVIGRLQAAAPGLRPPLFYSPYEAAAWSVLSARSPARQMMQVRERLSQAHGATFDLAGRPLAAFPAPSALLGVESFPGIPGDKIERLHGVARAALDGRLDAARLLRLGPDAAMAELQEIKGIGPFYSSLIVIRATGFTDVLPVGEPKALDLTARLYQLGAPPGESQFRQLAEAWRPFRTWATVLIRAVTPRLGDERAAGAASPGPAGRGRGRGGAARSG